VVIYLNPEIMTIAVKAFKRVRDIGDRITGGGARAFARKTFGPAITRAMQQRQLIAAARTILKPFPKLSTSLLWAATQVAAFPAEPTIHPVDSHSADESDITAALPASARRTYRSLRSMIFESERAA
jgi:hypothetical protein